MPAYQNPCCGTLWDVITDSADDVSIVAILNPNSGPGAVADGADPNYPPAISAFNNAGGRLIGYLPSGFGGAPIDANVTSTASCEPTGGTAQQPAYQPQDIIECADRYVTFFGENAIAGVFIDEMDEGEGITTEAAAAFYSQIIEGIRARHPDWLFFGNPGVLIDQSIAELLDTVVIYEGSSTGYGLADASSYQFQFDAGKFAALIHTGFDGGFSQALGLSRDNNTSYIFYTDEEGPPLDPNPYGQLPSDWSNQVMRVIEANASAADSGSD